MKNLDLKKLSDISKELRVLYVEDDNFILESMRSLLTDIFSEVRTASNGIEALEILAKESFDIILTDAIMPHMDGIDLIKRVKKEFPKITIGLISAVDDESIEEFKKLGVEQFIPKPVSPPELFGALFNLCELAKQKN
jgi:CheY-like chemotaxis protein